MFNSDLTVQTASSQLLTYPDVTVVCGKLQFREKRQDVVTNPLVIVEVLSPSTERYDRDTKRQEYQLTPSVTDVLLVSQNRPLIEHHARQSENQWLTSYISGLGAVVQITSLGIEIPLDEVYDQVVFPAQPDAPGGV